MENKSDRNRITPPVFKIENVCCHGDENENDHENNKTINKNIMTLEIPTIDWEQLNKERNRNNTLLSNQRKQLMKKELNRKGRRRKVTPTEAPSQSALKQLYALQYSRPVLHEEVLGEEDENDE